MKKLWILMILAMSTVSGLYAQQTDAPDQGESAGMETTTDITEEVEVTLDAENTNVSIKLKEDVVATSGTVYKSGVTDYVSSDVSFEIKANDSGSGVKHIWILIDNASFGVYNQAVNISAEGKHIIAYKVEDQVGNIGQIKNYEFVVDTSAPEVQARSQEKGVYVGESFYISASNKLILLAQDKLSGVAKVEYQLDNGIWQEYTGAIAFVGVSNGQHKLQYKATDNVGNESAVKNFMVFVDNGSPQVSISVEPDVFVKGGKSYASPQAFISLEAMDAETGVEVIFYTIDDGESMRYDQPFHLTPGVHTIKAQAMDILGNESDVVSMTIEIDGDDPTADLEAVK